MSTKFQLIAALLLTFHAGFSQHHADTTHEEKPKTSILLEQILSKKDLKNNLIRMETVTFPAGYSSTKHIHPCPLFIYVLEGELLSEFEGEQHIYKSGDTFYEKTGGLHSITKNHLETQHTTILVFYLMKEDMNTYIPIE